MHDTNSSVRKKLNLHITRAIRERNRHLRLLTAIVRYMFEKYILKRKRIRRNVLGFDFILDLEHKGVSSALAIYGIREISQTVLLTREIKPGMFCIDIGANIGYYTVIMASLVGKGGKICAFEPDSRNLDLLERNISLNKLRGIVDIYPCAVGDREGQAKMKMMFETNLNTLVAEYDNCKQHIVKEVIVSVTTIDKFFEVKQRSIDLIRMDIEGFEVEVISGGLKALRESRPSCKIFLEVHPDKYNKQRDFASILRNLFDLGFYPKFLVSTSSEPSVFFQKKGLVSSGSEPPILFQKKGYYPSETFSEGQFNGVFQNISEEDCIDFCRKVPKIVRYLILEKRNL